MNGAVRVGHFAEVKRARSANGAELLNIREEACLLCEFVYSIQLNGESYIQVG